MTAAQAGGDTFEEAGVAQRRETFLAAYSRNFKLAVVTLVLAVAVLPWALDRLLSLSDVTIPGHLVKKIAHVTHVQSADAEMRPEVTGQVNQAQLGNQVNEPALNSQDDKSIKLILAPAPAVTEDTPQGSLPRIGEDGRPPWQVYARPYNVADRRPRIALVITDLGLARAPTDAAISRLPTNVTMALDVQSPVVSAWGNRARQDGHEIIINVPMEPFDYPRSDPGPNTLLTSLPNSNNIERLTWALRECVGYVGITSFSGSRFATDPDKMRAVLDILKQRGLMIFDPRIAPHSVIMSLAKEDHIPYAVGTLQIDDELTPDAIDKTLARLEKEARLNGHAVGIAGSSPLVLDRLQLWLKNLPDRGISLAPLSAVVE